MQGGLSWPGTPRLEAGQGLCWGCAQALGIPANQAGCCSLTTQWGTDNGTNLQAGDRSPVRESVRAIGDEEMSRTGRMALEVKDEPQQCCRTPLAMLLPWKEGNRTCRVWCLWAQRAPLDDGGTGVNVGELLCGFVW